MTLFSNATFFGPRAQACAWLIWSSPFKCTPLCSSQTLKLILSWLNRDKKKHSCVRSKSPSCVPEVSGGEAKLCTSGMSVFVLLSLQEPVYRMYVFLNEVLQPPS